MFSYLGVLLFAGIAAGEVHTLTLKEAIDLAMRQNPDLVLARLDEQRATLAVQIARDPFYPKLFVGSGLAYTSGFPMSIEGSGPSIIQARAVQTLFDRQLKYQVAQARENARGAGIEAAGRREEVALRTGLLFLDVERAGRSAEMSRKQVDALEAIAQTIRARVAEGRELEIASRRAVLNIAKARQRAETLEAERNQAEGSLAMALGLAEGDRIRAAGETRIATDLPANEEAAVGSALADNREIRRLESAVLAKSHEIRAHQSARWPRMDLVAQYALFGKFNNYEDFFQRFERHNGQLGVSFQLPILPGQAAQARASQAEADVVRLRQEIGTARQRIALDVRRAFQDLKKVETGREVARLDLEVAREELSILLAQMEEGRASLRQVEEARFQETEKWIAFFDSQYAVERARLALIRQTGSVVAALK
jgi:outer membrane protein TolC